ncbi:hypothetical protein IW140_005289 [Coemansia sp. RSA 1813]|nr:hypothetical protein EV178_005770 [Coemansia sp. RSA 1646]KAJ1768790.1 hypothetical protein LPJ74_004590 [Coemansia sp. RSA 1843]KAJ2086369.1 hypothetical protein IW138_005740 [Coemansia sp. RSA 986]KAJ2212294.1 hypothetical protein EV179_004764 [Coemansia sp. RSA 487]KAJ2565600.1 hypothetical protein IW140_005289 [Coemansia sp. RSA 1813]
MDKDTSMQLSLEDLDVPDEFRNTGREWAVFEAPSNPNDQQHMPREIYFHERKLGISTWFQPIDYVILQNVQDIFALGKQWQEEETKKRRERARVRAKQDRPVSQTSMGGAWMSVATQQGRTYYYNRETQESTWVKPPDVKEEEDEGTEFNAEDAEWMLAQMGDSQEKIEETNEPTKVDDSQKLTKDELMAGFKQMLVDGSVDPFGAWDTQARKFQNDERITWISDEAERRDLFDTVCAQIIEQRNNKNKTQSSNIRTKDPFEALLHEQVHKRMPFSRFCAKSLSDPRYLAIKTSREREKRFKQFVEGKFPRK